MADQFANWGKLLRLAQEHKTKQALREAIAASGLRMHETDPWSGYYRCAAVKDGPLLPVAIWRDGERLYVMRNNEPVDLARVWPYCTWTPVSYEWFEQYEKDGKWPDEPRNDSAAQAIADKWGERRAAELHRGLRARPDATASEDHAVVLGHNNPPADDEIAEIRRQIEAAKGVAEQDYAEINDDGTAAAAQALRSRLNELAGAADKKREAEKRPHFEAAKAVDAKWQPVVKLGKGAADWLRDRINAYVTKKAAAEAEARRKALAEEAARAEEARKKAEAEGRSVEEVAPPPAADPAPAPAVTTTIKGATGRAASIRVVKKAVVVDYDKAYAHLKQITDIKAVIDKVAQRQIDAGFEVPGVEVHEERRVA